MQAGYTPTFWGTFSPLPEFSPGPLSFCNKVHLSWSLARVDFCCLQHCLDAARVTFLLLVDTVVTARSRCVPARALHSVSGQKERQELSVLWKAHLTWTWAHRCCQLLRNLVAGTHGSSFIRHLTGRQSWDPLLNASYFIQKHVSLCKQSPPRKLLKDGGLIFAVFTKILNAPPQNNSTCVQGGRVDRYSVNFLS